MEEVKETKKHCVTWVVKSVESIVDDITWYDDCEDEVEKDVLLDRMFNELNRVEVYLTKLKEHKYED